MAKSVIKREVHEQVDNYVEDSRTCEYAVNQKIKGKWLFAKIMLIVGYIVIVGGFFAVCCITNLIPVACFCPLIAWVLWFFTWKYVSVSYRYRIISGDMVFVKGYRNKFNTKMFTIKIKDCEVIAPYEAEIPGSTGFAPPKSSDDAKKAIAHFSAEKTLWAASSFDSPDLYYALFTNEHGERCVLYFEVTNKAIKLLKYYNAKTVVTKVRY